MALSSRFYLLERGNLFLQKRYSDAKEIYQNILVNSEMYTDIIYHFDRKTFLPHERLGQIYEIENNEEEAINHYIQALNENPLSVRIITKLYICYVNTMNHKKCMNLLVIKI